MSGVIAPGKTEPGDGVRSANASQTDVTQLTSPYWENFTVAPMEYRDTDEYEMVEIPETTYGTGAIDASVQQLSFINKNVDPYYYFRKAYIRIYGFMILVMKQLFMVDGLKKMHFKI